MYDSRILIIDVQILTNSFWVQIFKKDPHLKCNHSVIFRDNKNRRKFFETFEKIGNFRHDFVKVSILNYHLNDFLINLNDSKYIYGI